MNIGVMGGTFDPVHLGHLAVAEEARRLLGTSELVFVPAGHPYFKSTVHISPSVHRVKMLNLALAEKPYFKVSLIEIQQSGPSYALDTVLRMKETLGAGGEIFFILGWDSLLSLPRWKDPERLMRFSRLVVAPRPGFPKPDVSILEKDLPGISQRVIVMEKPVLDISSTEIRERVSQGLPIDHLAPRAVAGYIKEHGLYASAKPRGATDSVR
jgi:nicotinate-nucleotide adenylyltransferase